MPNNPVPAAATGLPSSLNILDPASLPEEYGLHVKGDCMAPEIPDGSFVCASRSQPYKVGDLVILWWRPEFISGGQQAIIKRLVMAPPPYVKLPYRENPKSEVHAVMMVEMLKPHQAMWIKCERLLAIHKCLGAIPAEQARRLTDKERSKMARAAARL